MRHAGGVHLVQVGLDRQERTGMPVVGHPAAPGPLRGATRWTLPSTTLMRIPALRSGSASRRRLSPSCARFARSCAYQRCARCGVGEQTAGARGSAGSLAHGRPHSLVSEFAAAAGPLRRSIQLAPCRASTLCSLVAYLVDDFMISPAGWHRIQVLRMTAADPPASCGRHGLDVPLLGDDPLVVLPATPRASRPGRRDHGGAAATRSARPAARAAGRRPADRRLGLRRHPRPAAPGSCSPGSWTSWPRWAPPPR